MPQSVNSTLQIYTEGLHKIYGNTIEQIILYGSYARGDYQYSSDVDILVLVTLNDDEIRSLKTALADYTFDMEMEYGIEFSPIVINSKMYYHTLDILPFYQNIQREGITLYE
ncbi:nucleotidyltransferase domain-containing protein [bacterium D16-51]|nr:nucleotidyltransferase domain-containing protein [bacterium D16-59]RKI54434.1 nucleotidyltransferase domain-containing protein [bacterium D16-51]